MSSANGAKAAAIKYTLIETAKLDGIDPQAWHTDILDRVADYKINGFDKRLPWRYYQNLIPDVIQGSDPEHSG